MSMKKKLQFVTRFHENRIFSLGGKTFFSKRLNGQEEMELQRIQLIAMNAAPAEIINLEIDFYVDLLNFRATTEQSRVDRDFVTDNMSKLTGIKFLVYLRTGEGLKPGETFDLPMFEGFEIDDRKFTGRCLSYREALFAGAEAERAEAEKIKESGENILAEAERLEAAQAQLLGVAEGQEGDAPDMTPEQYEDALAAAVEVGLRVHAEAVKLSEITAETVAGFLNARLVEGEPINGRWLLERITEADVAEIIYFLTNGEAPEPEGDAGADDAGGADTPNAPATGGVSA